MIQSEVAQPLKFFAFASFACAFIFFLFTYATGTISDPDFWWHLKTGEVMVQQGGVLQADPFNFTGDGVVSAREFLILRGYWLWQFAVYGLYALFGFKGISLFKILSVGVLATVVVYQMHRQRVDRVVAVPLLALGFFLFSRVYLLERPQVVSFLCASILLGLLSRVKDGDRLGWTLPVLMAVWANLHGGFVVGDLILLCFAAGVVIEYRDDRSRMKHLLLWVAVGVFASLFNPNGGLVFGELVNFQNSSLMSGVAEYQSTWIIFHGGRRMVAILWLLIVLYGVGVWFSRCRYWPELLVAFFLAWFSVLYLRNVGFFALAMLPAIGCQLQQCYHRRSWSVSPFVASFIVLFSAAFLLWQGGELWQKQSQEGTVSSFYPIDSTAFILSSGLQGRMFNSYNWGGYQLWKFYPQRQVFIDGRGLDPDVYSDWRLIASASLEEKGGRKEFEVLLDRYAVDYVVQPHIYEDTGRLTPLVKFLIVKPEWIPVYIDHQSYILVRLTQKNASVIDRYRMDKRDFNNRMIDNLITACNRAPTEISYVVGLTEMLIFVGRYDEAMEKLTVISKMEPDNAALDSMRNQLDVLMKRK